MAKVFAIYKKPADPLAFDSYYFGKHVPLAKTLPGLRRYEVTEGPLMTPGGEAPVHMVAILTFDSLPAIHAALVSPEGVATAADLAKFAQAGVELMYADTREI